MQPDQVCQNLLGQIADMLDEASFDENSLYLSWPLIKPEDSDNRIHQRIITRQFDALAEILTLCLDGRVNLSPESAYVTAQRTDLTPISWAGIPITTLALFNGFRNSLSRTSYHFCW